METYTAQAEYCMNNLDNQEVKEYIREHDKELYLSRNHQGADTFGKCCDTDKSLADKLKPGGFYKSTGTPYVLGDVVKVLASDKMALILMRHSNFMHPNDFFADFNPIMFL